jgi:hypothetical protein
MVDTGGERRCRRQQCGFHVDTRAPERLCQLDYFKKRLLDFFTVSDRRLADREF